MKSQIIDSFIEYIRDELAYSAHTVRSYGDDLAELRDFVSGSEAAAFDPTTVTTNDIRAWVASMGRRGLSAAAIKRKLSAARAFYRFLIRRHGATQNPAVAVTINRRERPLPKFIDTNEMGAVLDEMDADAQAGDDFESVRNDLIINLLYQTGMRASELVGLTDERIDCSRSELKVLGKRNKERIVPISEHLAALIDRYRAIRPAAVRSGQPLLTDADGRPLDYQRVYRIVRQSLDGRVSSPKRSPHVLRHTFATDMLNGGADLTGVRKLLGHESLATTQIYTHVSVAEIRDSYMKAHPRARNNRPDNTPSR